MAIEIQDFIKQIDETSSSSTLVGPRGAWVSGRRRRAGVVAERRAAAPAEEQTEFDVVHRDR